MPTTHRIALAAFLAFFLAACGGGDPESDDIKTPNPPDCSVQPSPCK